jgi:hypothetical protein
MRKRAALFFCRRDDSGFTWTAMSLHPPLADRSGQGHIVA